jgi:6-phosphofructokinase 1
LIPEIPYRLDSVIGKIRDREQQGKHYTMIVVAEGARPENGDFVTAAGAQANRETRLGGIGASLAAQLEQATGKEARSVVLGHLQRGGSPTNMDRTLCTMFGAKAVELIAEQAFGQMVAFTGTHIVGVPLRDAIGTLRTVPRDGAYVWTARSLGICLGDH